MQVRGSLFGRSFLAATAAAVVFTASLLLPVHTPGDPSGVIDGVRNRVAGLHTALIRWPDPDVQGFIPRTD